VEKSQRVLSVWPIFKKEKEMLTLKVLIMVLFCLVLFCFEDETKLKIASEIFQPLN
jgi:hypothetical protein